MEQNKNRAIQYFLREALCVHYHEHICTCSHRLTNTQVKNIGALTQNSPSGESFHLQLSGCPSMPAEKGPSSYNSSLYVPVNN